MPNRMLEYTNGVGHLIMSIFMTLIGLLLIIYPGLPSSTNGVGIGVILAVQTAWFVPGAARQVAHEVAKQVPAAIAAATTGGLNPPATPPNQVAAGHPTVEIVYDSTITSKLPKVGKS